MNDKNDLDMERQEAIEHDINKPLIYILFEHIIDGVKLLEKNLEMGCYLSKEGAEGLWWLYSEDGEGIVSAKTVTALIVLLDIKEKGNEKQTE